MRAILDRLRFRRWGKWIIIGVVASVVISAAAVETTSQSWFCSSCHIMEPYYDSWKVGTHKDVKCVECHIEPGVTNFVSAKLNGLGQVVDDLLYRTSTKPSASVSALSCTRSGCHSVETLNKKVIAGKFKFDHSKHIGAAHLGVQLTCGTCHSHVKGDQHFEVNTTVCITCHLVSRVPDTLADAGAKSAGIIYLAARNGSTPESSHKSSIETGEKIPPSACTTCHEPPRGEILYQGLKFDHAQFLAFGAKCDSCHHGVTATPPPIDDGRCLQCHTFGTSKGLDAREMHKIHTLGRHKIECFSCHGTVRHGTHVQPASMENFDCTKCHSDQHKVQRETFFNPGQSPHAAGSTATMSPMFLAHVDCTGCHTSPRAVSIRPDTGATVMAAEPASCDRCHQAGFGAKMIPLWQDATHKLYDQVEGRLREAEAAGIDAEAIKKVKLLLSLVKTDGSWGVHNPRYTQMLLEQARDALTAAGAKNGGGQ